MFWPQNSEHKGISQQQISTIEQHLRNINIQLSHPDKQKLFFGDIEDQLPEHITEQRVILRVTGVSYKRIQRQLQTIRLSGDIRFRG